MLFCPCADMLRRTDHPPLRRVEGIDESHLTIRDIQGGIWDSIEGGDAALAEGRDFGVCRDHRRGIVLLGGLEAAIAARGEERLNLFGEDIAEDVAGPLVLVDAPMATHAPVDVLARGVMVEAVAQPIFGAVDLFEDEGVAIITLGFPLGNVEGPLGHRHQGAGLDMRIFALDGAGIHIGVHLGGAVVFAHRLGALICLVWADEIAITDKALVELLHMGVDIFGLGLVLVEQLLPQAF